MARTILELVFSPGGLTVALQPIVDVSARPRLTALEGLIRGPALAEFERVDLLFDYVRRSKDESPVDRACTTTVLRAAGLLDCLMDVVVNVGANTLVYDAEFPAHLARAAQEAGISSERLVIDVNDCEPLLDDSRLHAALADFAATGLRVALADEGLPESEPRRVRECSPSYLRIDRTAVTGCDRSALKRRRIARLVELAAAAGARPVAIGVETEAELRVVTECGVHLVQGTYFAPALTVEDLAIHPLYLELQGQESRAAS